VIATMQNAMQKGTSLRDTIIELAMRPEFRTKFVDPTK
jgi:hypothetical protein